MWRLSFLVVTSWFPSTRRALGNQLVLWHRTSNRRPWLVHGVGGSSRGHLYDSHHSPQPEPTHSWLARTGPSTITALLLYLWLTDADMCPLAHPPLPESNCRIHRLPWRGLVTGACGAATATSRDDICETSSAEAERRAMLSLILSGVAGLAQLQWWPLPCNARHSS